MNKRNRHSLPKNICERINSTHIQTKYPNASNSIESHLLSSAALSFQPVQKLLITFCTNIKHDWIKHNIWTFEYNRWMSDVKHQKTFVLHRLLLFLPLSNWQWTSVKISGFEINRVRKNMRRRVLKLMDSLCLQINLWHSIETHKFPPDVVSWYFHANSRLSNQFTPVILRRL